MCPFCVRSGWPVIRPTLHDGHSTVYLGDCLEVMRDMSAATVDAVICDPPYIVGATSVGNVRSKSGTWADMENAAHWFSMWMAEARRVLRPTGHLFAFTNWRSTPTMIRAGSLAGFAWSGCCVWDKQWIGPGGPKSFRPRYELIMHAPMSDAAISNRSVPDIYECKWHGAMRTTDHAAEKPVELMRWLVSLIAEPGAVVLDPFAGSGSTMVAAQAEGVRCIGIEREAAWVEVIRSRLAQLPLSETVAGAGASDE